MRTVVPMQPATDAPRQRRAGPAAARRLAGCSSKRSSSCCRSRCCDPRRSRSCRCSRRRSPASSSRPRISRPSSRDRCSGSSSRWRPCSSSCISSAGAGRASAVIGLAPDRPAQDLARGVVLVAFVGLAGVGVYLAAVELGVNRFVLPVPPLGHWWTIPALVLNAVEAGLVEEVIVLGYLVTQAAAAVVDTRPGDRGERAPPRLVPPVSGLGRVRREPRDGSALRVPVPAVGQAHVAVRGRPRAPRHRRRGRVHPLPRSAARVLIRRIRSDPGRVGYDWCRDMSRM